MYSCQSELTTSLTNQKFEMLILCCAATVLHSVPLVDSLMNVGRIKRSAFEVIQIDRLYQFCHANQTRRTEMRTKQLDVSVNGFFRSKYVEPIE